MASRNASQKQQMGMTLIELLIASLLSSMTIGVIGALFIQGQQLATKRSQQLLVTQSVSSVMLQLKQDIQRAGFHHLEPVPAMLADASSIVHIEQNPSLIGYVYQLLDAKTEPFRNVVFKREISKRANQGDALKVCEKHSVKPLSVASASLSGAGGFCYNLFDPAQISVSDFSLTSQEVKGEAGGAAQLLTLSLSAHLTRDLSVSHQSQITLLTRNRR